MFTPGGSSIPYRSTDGLNWTAGVSFGAGNQICSPAVYGSSGYIVPCLDGNIRKSTNGGATWAISGSLPTVPAGGQSLTPNFFDGVNYFITYSNTSLYVAKTTNGTGTASAVAVVDGPSAIAYGGGEYLIVSQGETISSKDGFVTTTTTSNGITNTATGSLSIDGSGTVAVLGSSFIGGVVALSPYIYYTPLQ